MEKNDNEKAVALISESMLETLKLMDAQGPSEDSAATKRMICGCIIRILQAAIGDGFCSVMVYLDDKNTMHINSLSMSADEAYVLLEDAMRRMEETFNPAPQGEMH